jgi:uncharacterized protein YrzB (UPF0473 family)
MTGERDDIIVLIDESTGKEIEFEFLSTVEYNDNEYVCLIPVEGSEDENGEFEGVVIMKIVKGKDDEEQLMSIDDDAEYEAVFEKMQEELGEDECGDDCECDSGCSCSKDSKEKN